MASVAPPAKRAKKGCGMCRKVDPPGQGKTVPWVQCDTCHSWFHWLCTVVSILHRAPQLKRWITAPFPRFSLLISALRLRSSVTMNRARFSAVFALLLAALVCSSEAARSSRNQPSNSFRRAANAVYQSLSNVFGEDNIKGLYKFFSKTTERFVHGVDSFLDTLWKIWSDLLDVMGIDSSNLSQYFSPASLSTSPARALLLVAAVLVSYWFLSMFLGGFFYLLHAVFGRFLWVARVLLFALSCLYILQKFEGDPEKAVLPLCFVMALYFMTGPVGAYWRRAGGQGSLEEKIDHLDTQVRLLNIRLSRVIDSLERVEQ
uniref:PHD-type domain-containing protein n=2 Tax=Knipowitschia caucasica TaxID=637954 RepID=A0AAV2MQF5_KNICA